MPSSTSSSSAESTTATARLARTISDFMLDSVWRDITSRTAPISSRFAGLAPANGDSDPSSPENTGAENTHSRRVSRTSRGACGIAKDAGDAPVRDSLAYSRRPSANTISTPWMSGKFRKLFTSSEALPESS